MKSYYHTLSRSEIARAAQEAARSELNAMRDELYAKVERDCTYQALATAFAVLHREFGFGAKRKSVRRGGRKVRYFRVKIGDETLMIQMPSISDPKWVCKTLFGEDVEPEEVSKEQYDAFQAESEADVVLKGAEPNEEQGASAERESVRSAETDEPENP